MRRVNRVKDEVGMTRIETVVTVSEDGASARVDLPVHVSPGRHPAIVIIEDENVGVAKDAANWAARTYGALKDADFERPPALPLEERMLFE